MTISALVAKIGVTSPEKKQTPIVYSQELSIYCSGVEKSYFHAKDEVVGSIPTRRKPVAQLVRARRLFSLVPCNNFIPIGDSRG